MELDAALETVIGATNRGAPIPDEIENKYGALKAWDVSGVRDLSMLFQYRRLNLNNLNLDISH